MDSPWLPCRLRCVPLAERNRGGILIPPQLLYKRRVFRGLGEQIRKEDTMIIAVDFDGILCDNEFPEIGKPHYEMIAAVREAIDCGHEVILWTSRVDERLSEAVAWCVDRGLHFTSINDNAPSNKQKYEHLYPNGTRKVYADVYIDDHNLFFIRANFVLKSEYYNKSALVAAEQLRRVINEKG